MTNIRREPCGGWMNVGCVTYYRISQSDMSIKDLFSLTIVFELFIMDFDLSLPVEDKFYESNYTGEINCLLGLDRIFK